MAVTVNVYNALASLILSKSIDLTNLRIELLTTSATWTPTHSSKEQVDNGSKATVTMTIASPGVITDTAHGFSAGQAVAIITTGALPTGVTPSTFYYVISPTTNTYELSATVGGSAIVTTGTQSGVHTRYSSGTYEAYGNGQPPGGVTLTGVTTATGITGGLGNVDGAILTATNPDVTATGGSLPPTAAWGAQLYDATHMYPLMFINFGQAEQAGNTTHFVMLINALGLLNLTAP